MSDESLYDAFGVQSPNSDTKQIQVGAICHLGKGTNQERQDFQFQYNSLRRILRNISNQTPIWAHGPSGCGKTELSIQIGVRLNRPVFVINFGEESSLRELLGTMKIESKSVEAEPGEDTGLKSMANALWALAKQGLGMQTKFQYGQLPLAMQVEDAIIVLDEFNMAPAGIAAQLNRFLETGTLVIPDTGEEIHSAPGVAVVVCSNTEGGADESGLFAGSQAQNGATRSRFAYISLDYPEPEQERQILLSRVPDIDSISTIGDKPFSALAIELGTACRALVNEGAVSLPYTVRNMLRFGQSTKELHDYSDGFRDAYFDGLSPSEQVPVDEVFKKYFGVHLLPQPENNSTA